MKPIVFSNLRIFDGSGEALYPGEVRVADERIEQVSRGGERVRRENADVLDCRGMTLMPGLVEAHAHLSWPSSVERVVNTMRLPAEEHLLVTAHNARVLLDHGFTSAYSAGALGERFEVALRDMIANGFMPGPRLRASTLEKGAEGVMGVPAGHDEAAALVSPLEDVPDCLALSDDDDAAGLDAGAACSLGLAFVFPADESRLSVR